MKKLLVPIMVVALVALTVPAWAQYGGFVGNTDKSEAQCNVSLDAHINVDKDVTIKYYQDDCFKTYINKTYCPDSRADAEAVKNDLNFDNKVRVGASDFADKMDNSFGYFTGIGQSNQAAGQMNNQGNVVSVAYVSSSNAYATAYTGVGITNKNNEFYANVQGDDGGSILSWFGGRDCTLTQTDTLKDSFNGFIGIGQNNQSSGSMNNQNNAISVAAGVDEGGFKGLFAGKGNMVAMASSDLALTNTCNKFTMDKVTFTNSMCNSFNGFTGIGQSNQSAGNMNNQANVVSVAAGVSLCK
jgi:hypothetical protein